MAAARCGLEILSDAGRGGDWSIPPREQRWLDKLRAALDAAPTDADALRAATQARYGARYDPAAYGLTR